MFQDYLGKIFWSFKCFKSVSTKKCKNMSVNNIKTVIRNVTGASQIFVQIGIDSQGLHNK